MCLGAATNPGLRRSLHSRLRPGLNFRLTSHMNFKTTVILLILLAAVGGYLFFTRDSGEPKPKKHEEHKLLDVASTSDVSKVTVSPAAGKPTTLEKKGKD